MVFFGNIFILNYYLLFIENNVSRKCEIAIEIPSISMQIQISITNIDSRMLTARNTVVVIRSTQKNIKRKIIFFRILLNSTHFGFEDVTNFLLCQPPIANLRCGTYFLYLTYLLKYLRK